MRLLVVTQMFWPENFRINDLVAGLVERGHEVVVLTGLPNYPKGSWFAGYGLRGPWTETHAGARVLRVPMIPRGRGGGVRLAINYLSFAVAASFIGAIRCRGHFDAIFVFEPSPVTVGLPAIVLKHLRDAPIFFWVLDLWPDSVRAVGAVRSEWVLGAIGRLVRYIYRESDWILVQSPAFVDAVRQFGVDERRILFFPSWAEPVFTDPPARRAAVARPSLPPGRCIMFAGNIGVAQDFPTIIDAAERLRDRKDLHWVVVGDGRMGPWAREEAVRRRLVNVHFWGSYPLEDMPDILAAADVLLVTLKPDPVFARTIPGKVQAYLAVGRAVIGMLEGEGARVIQEAGCGTTCTPGDAAALAAAAGAFAEMSADRIQSLGRAGKAYYASHFERRMLFDRLEAWMGGRGLPDRSQGPAREVSDVS